TARLPRPSAAQSTFASLFSFRYLRQPSGGTSSPLYPVGTLAARRLDRPRARLPTQARRDLKPTISLDVNSLVASSYGYFRGQIEQPVAHHFAVQWATQSERAKRPQHRHPPHA